jgi:hypothetical protein
MEIIAMTLMMSDSRPLVAAACAAALITFAGHAQSEDYSTPNVISEIMISLKVSRLEIRAPGNEGEDI